jgi:hypothetical protein
MISTTEHLAGMPAGLTVIETRAQALEAACQNLDLQLADLERDLEAVKSKHLRGLKKQAAIVANLEAELHSAVEQAPDLFKKPRTVTLHGIKLGFQSSAGAITWHDNDQVVALIKKHFKGRETEFIKVEETPKKDALRALTEAELVKVGCRIEGAGDQVLIKRLDGEVEKMFGKLIDKLVAAMIGEE